MSGNESIYGSPNAFFEDMDYIDNASMVPNERHYTLPDQFTDQLMPNSKVNNVIDPLLSSNQMNAFSLSEIFWSDLSQIGVLQTINPTLSPPGGNRSHDTGYGSQGTSSDKFSPIDFAESNQISTKQTNSRGRKRPLVPKAVDAKPVRKTTRPSKPASVINTFDDEEEESEREQFLARNRKAASKCRHKKKKWTQDLEQKACDLSSQKQILTMYVAMLKNELLVLKGKCLEHSDCSCYNIRDYLKNTILSMPPANASLYSKLESKMASTGLAAEIARKQSSVSSWDIDSLSSLGDSNDSPGSAGGDADPQLMQLEADLQAAVKP